MTTWEAWPVKLGMEPGARARLTLSIEPARLFLSAYGGKLVLDWWMASPCCGSVLLPSRATPGHRFGCSECSTPSRLRKVGWSSDEAEPLEAFLEAALDSAAVLGVLDRTLFAAAVADRMRAIEAEVFGPNQASGERPVEAFTRLASTFEGTLL